MASILKVDDLRGNTSAGDITITSEGGAATQSLQQGLAKAWFLYNGQGTPAFRDSFNGSSLTDHATGDHSVTFTNNMSNANYSLSAATGDGDNASGVPANLRRGASTTSAQRNTTNYASTSSNGTYDYAYIGGSIHGDLA